jgi:hypothetical protein
MKTTGLIFLGAVILLSACVKETVRRSKVYKSGDVEITFRDFTDSRCPEGATCVWEGEATVMLTISNDDESIDFTLVGIGSDTTLLNHNIEFVDLLPYPKSGVEIDPDDKELKLNVTKL